MSYRWLRSIRMLYSFQTQVRKSAALIALSFAVLLTSRVQAEVTKSNDLGFVVTHTVTVSMPPPAAWSALSDVGRWWDPEHTYSGDSRNLSLQPYVGGCFCERWGMYNGVEHMVVINARPPKSLRLRGGLGPLQELAVNAILTWNIEAAAGGSKITLAYTVGGYSPQPLSAIAPLVDGVLGVQVQRLGRFISTGNPDDGKSEPKK